MILPASLLYPPSCSLRSLPKSITLPGASVLGSVRKEPCLKPFVAWCSQLAFQVTPALIQISDRRLHKPAFQNIQSGKPLISDYCIWIICVASITIWYFRKCCCCCWYVCSAQDYPTQERKDLAYFWFCRILNCLVYGNVTQCVCSVLSDSLQSHGLQPPRLLCLWGSSKQVYWNGLPISSSRGSLGLSPCFLCLLHWQTASLPLS